MFRQLARLYEQNLGLPGTQAQQAQTAAELVLSLHPMQVSRYLEESWSASTGTLTIPREEIPGSLIPQERDSGVDRNMPATIPNLPPGTYPFAPAVWDHLIYAYMIENTRVFEIFRRVLEEYFIGELLDVPSPAGQLWIRTTEALFYNEASPLNIYSVRSSVRPDVRASRRNAYYRMFGMDLNHGTNDNRPYAYPKPPASNVEFVGTFEEFQREVWRGVENFTNTSGPRPTDDAAIANLARALYDMLRVRRRNGNLLREELFFVSTMSWFHLALMYDTPIVVDLKAQAPSAEERLEKIGERVGLPAHSKSHSYIHLAEAMSPILRAIENADFNTEVTAPTLYSPNAIRERMMEIITHWSIATGRDMKARKVTVSGQTLPGTVSRPPVTNGRPPVVRQETPA